MPTESIWRDRVDGIIYLMIARNNFFKKVNRILYKFLI